MYQNNRIRIRPYYTDDAGGMCDCIQHSIAEMKLYLPWVHDNYQLADSEKWVEWAKANWQYGVQYDFVIEDKAEARFLGGVGLLDVNRIASSAFLGYWIDSRYTGQGIAYQAAKLAIEFATKELQLKQLIIYMSTDNKASQHIAKKLGAVYLKTVNDYETVNGKALACEFYRLDLTENLKDGLAIFMK